MLVALICIPLSTCAFYQLIEKGDKEEPVVTPGLHSTFGTFLTKEELDETKRQEMLCQFNNANEKRAQEQGGNVKKEEEKN